MFPKLNYYAKTLFFDEHTVLWLETTLLVGWVVGENTTISAPNWVGLWLGTELGKMSKVIGYEIGNIWIC